jgi:hypothetical protein
LNVGSRLDGFLAAIEQAPPVAELRESVLAYPLVNALHIVGVALLFGAIIALDLRLIGWRRTSGPVDSVAGLLLPVAISGLLLAIPAGLLLFATDARAYASSPLFQAKMLVIALALGNVLWLRTCDWRGERPPRRVAVAGAASMLLWLAAIILGRLVGYF